MQGRHDDARRASQWSCLEVKDIWLLWFERFDGTIYPKFGGLEGAPYKRPLGVPVPSILKPLYLGGGFNDCCFQSAITWCVSTYGLMLFVRDLQPPTSLD